MRLSRLDLTRYGKFTDFSIDFGRAVAGQPDLHLIYGPNEAGKSTTFSAWLDLLFGIEHQSSYGFRHPYPTMRIGALVEAGGEARELVRIKRLQNSLLDPAGQALAEHAALPLPGGIDRAAYKTMFSLDESSLEAGGESILASKGDLGQLLFSASAGLAELSRSLGGIAELADGFYRFRARSGGLAELKSRLSELREARRAIDVQAADFARLVDERETCRQRYDAALAERSGLQARLEDFGRHLRALPRFAEWLRASTALEPLALLPDAPAGWVAELPRLQARHIELEAARAAVQAEIATLSEEIDAITVDEDALALGNSLEGLAILHARFIAAEEDIPVRRDEQTAIAQRIADLKRSISGDVGEATLMMLNAATIGVLRGLIQRRSGVEGALASARDEFAEAERRSEVARRKADAGGAEDVGEAATIGLAVSLAAVRDSDHAARYRLAERASRTLRETLEDHLRALAPWSGDIDALAALDIPAPARMEGWERELDEAELAIAREQGNHDRLCTEKRRLAVELGALEKITGIVTDHDAAAARSARERAWAEHRRALDAETAEAFETHLRRDDIVTGARLANSSAVERVNQVSQAQALVRAQIEEARLALATARAGLDAIAGEVALAVANLAPLNPAEFDFLRLQQWLELRQRAVEAGSRLRQAERELAEALEDGRSASERLASSLADAGVSYPADASLDRLSAIAQAALERQAEQKRMRALVEDSERDLDARRQVLLRAEAADQAWHSAWADACAGNWLSSFDPLPDAAAMGEILSRIVALEPLLREHDRLVDRIAKMGLDQQAFAAEIASIARPLNLPADMPALAAYRSVEALIARAREDAQRMADRRRRLEGALQRKADVDEKVTVNDRLGAAITGHLGVMTLDEAADALRQLAARAELRQRSAELEDEIIATMRTSTLAEARTLLEASEPSAMDEEIAGLTPRVEALDQQLRELFSAHAKASERVQSVGDDDAVARLEQERQTVMIEIEERAQDWVRLRAGVLATEMALRAYRDRHRSAMMQRASDAFATVSRGAYSGLSTQPRGEGEVLVAQGADGASKLAADMSRGTRFQLYLALRVAGYLEFAATRQPVPFVADDIMETFDDMRAEEAFRLFAMMAGSGQVIYLTHHRHLIDIAQRVLPSVTVHQLPG